MESCRKLGTSGPFSYLETMGYDPFIKVVSPKVSREQVGRLVGSMEKEGRTGGMEEEKLKFNKDLLWAKTLEHVALFINMLFAFFRES